MSDPYQDALSRALSVGGSGDWYRLGSELYARGMWGSAAGCFARCVAADSEDHRGWTNLGWCLHLVGRHKEARDVLDRAIVLAPGEARPRALMGQVLLTLGGVSWALRSAKLGAELGPGEAVNRVGYALALFAAGEWEKGWLEYEHRFAYKIPEFLTRPYRLWRGESVGHLYVEAEQGLGDALMALRWVPLAAERAERVTLFVHGALYGLCESAWVGRPGNVAVLPLPRPLPEADAWCPMMSLPAALGLGGPEPVGAYIRGVREDVVSFGGVPFSPVKRVGICWAGNPTHEQARHRDCPLENWLRLAELPGVELHSLQVGDAAGEMSQNGAFGLVLDRGPEITNFLDTAKVVAGLDLVITVDTAVAHLAGAMRVPCWMLVNQRGRDFRWGVAGETTGWYPSMRLVRRGLEEDWGSVMRRVEGMLREALA